MHNHNSDRRLGHNTSVEANIFPIFTITLYSKDYDKLDLDSFPW